MTANLEAGLMDLEKLGARMTKQALAMKLMEELKSQEVGTNEIEAKSWERSSQRELKRGNIQKARDLKA